MTVHATCRQILEAFSRLTEADLLALRESARQRCGGTRFSEPLDLLHEALHLMLEGRRNWPLRVDFPLFLSMTMRSIANAERRRQETRLTVRVSFEEAAEAAPWQMGATRSAEDEADAAEQGRICSAVLNRARETLADDARASAVFMGLLDGQSPAALRDSLSMSKKEFDAARHRAMRKAKASATLH